MDCETCKNYVPKKQESPFDGVKTDELKVGMLLRAFYEVSPSKGFFVVVEKPDSEKVKVIRVFKGNEPFETEMLLARYGCQPYESGRWNQESSVQEVV